MNLKQRLRLSWKAIKLETSVANAQRVRRLAELASAAVERRCGRDCIGRADLPKAPEVQDAAEACRRLISQLEDHERSLRKFRGEIASSGRPKNWEMLQHLFGRLGAVLLTYLDALVGSGCFSAGSSAPDDIANNGKGTSNEDNGASRASADDDDGFFVIQSTLKFGYVRRTRVRPSAPSTAPSTPSTAR